MSVAGFYFGFPFGAVWSNLIASALCFALGYAAALRKLKCNQPRCYRFGTEKVPGTTFRTCHHHTTAAHHAALYQAHSEKRPDQHQYLKGSD
jgi:hypothetical protein